MVADSPGSGAFFLGIANGMRLAVDARLHDVVLADRTIVNVDV